MRPRHTSKKRWLSLVHATPQHMQKAMRIAGVHATAQHMRKAMVIAGVCDPKNYAQSDHYRKRTCESATHSKSDGDRWRSTYNRVRQMRRDMPVGGLNIRAPSPNAKQRWRSLVDGSRCEHSLESADNTACRMKTCATNSGSPHANASQHRPISCRILDLVS